MKKNDWVAKTRTAIEWIYILSLVGALIICLILLTLYLL